MRVAPRLIQTPPWRRVASEKLGRWIETHDLATRQTVRRPSAADGIHGSIDEGRIAVSIDHQQQSVGPYRQKSGRSHEEPCDDASLDVESVGGHLIHV